MTPMEKKQYQGTPQIRMSELKDMQTSELPRVFFDEHFDLHVSKADFDKPEQQEFLDEADEGVSRKS